MGQSFRVVNEILNVTTLAPTGATKTAVVSTDVVAGSRFFYNPKFASTAAGGALVVWGHNADNDTATTGDVQARVFNSSGVCHRRRVQSLHSDWRRRGGGVGHAAWQWKLPDHLERHARDLRPRPSLTDIMGRIVTAAGTPAGSEFRINANAPRASARQRSGDAGQWQCGRSLGDRKPDPIPGFAPTGIQGRFINAAGTPAGTEFSVDTISGGTYEERTLDVVVAWQRRVRCLLGADGGLGWRKSTFSVSTPAQAAKLALKLSWSSPRSGDRNILNYFVSELANGGFAVGWRLTGGGPELHQIRQYTMNGVEIGTEANLEALAGGSGLGRFDHAELMSNGKVMMLGYVGLTAVANQVFDLGDEALRGTNGVETLYGKDGVNDVIVGNGGNDGLNGFSGNDNDRWRHRRRSDQRGGGQR